MRDEDGNWVIKDNHQTYPVIKLTQFLNTKHASGAVYQVGDQFTETRYDRKTATGRERPIHSPAEEHDCQEMKGKAQPSADRKLIPAISSQVKAKPTGIKQHPNQTKTTHTKKQHPKEKIRLFSVQ